MDPKFFVMALCSLATFKSTSTMSFSARSSSCISAIPNAQAKRCSISLATEPCLLLHIQGLLCQSCHATTYRVQSSLLLLLSLPIIIIIIIILFLFIFVLYYSYYYLYIVSLFFVVLNPIDRRNMSAHSDNVAASIDICSVYSISDLSKTTTTDYLYRCKPLLSYK